MPRLLAAALVTLLLTPGVAGSAPCADCLLAGAASVALRVPPGTPLAGYGALARRLVVPDLFGRQPHAFWFRPHQGALDDVRARALVVDAPDGRLVWIAADLVAVGRTFTARVARRLGEIGVPAATLVVSASHTHSGPGAYVDSALMGFVAVDREDPTVRDALVESLVDAVRRAEAAKAPARAAAGRAQAPGLTKGRLGHAVDSEVVVVKFVAAGGAPVAALWNYAIHGTTLGSSNLALSGDVAGAASVRLERELGVPALFVNGAVGDVSPERHGAEGMALTARAIASAAREAWNGARPGRVPALALRTTRVGLPAPRLPLHNCLARWVPRRLRLPLDGAFPRDAELVAGRLGDAMWVTVPGELQSSLGESIKRASAGRPAFVAGLTNDYLGYFVSAADHDRVSYVTCASLYGSEAGERLAQAAADLLRAVAGTIR